MPPDDERSGARATDGPPPAGAWPRRRPTIGDASSARERAAAPRDWAFPPEAVESIAAVIDARRDVRSFRSDPVDDETLRRILTAAHRAPSVGHSQPWRFVVVTAQETRDKAAWLADRERLRQADQLGAERRRQLLDLKLEGIRDAPTGIVVGCDRRTDAAGILGRATMRDADMWSTACAIENLWLAARSEGVGVGWVTLFDPDDLAELVGFPAGVAALGWLCVGWPDERLAVPGLERHGWSERLSLDAVVALGRWPADDAPAPPVHHAAGPAPAAVVSARDHADGLLTPTGSLGVLDRGLDRLHAVVGDPDRELRAALVLAAADHPVTAHDVSAFPSTVTRDVLEATVAGVSIGAATARACGLRVVAVDAGVAGGPVPGAVELRVDGPRGDLVHRDAMTPAAARRQLALGADLASGLTDVDIVALGEVGIGNTTIAAALACALTGLDGAAAAGRGAGADHAMIARKASVITRALARVDAVDAAGDPAGDPADPVAVLAQLGGPELAVLAGVTLGAARAGKLVVLDGLATTVAALLAVRLEPATATFLVAGQRSRERAHDATLAELGLEPLLDLRLHAGEGVGALHATHLLLTAWTARRTTAHVVEV